MITEKQYDENGELIKVISDNIEPVSQYLLRVPKSMMNSLRRISQIEQKTIKQVIRDTLDRMIKRKLK